MVPFATAPQHDSCSDAGVFPPRLVATSSPDDDRHSYVQEVLMKTVQELSKHSLAEVSNVASDMSTAPFFSHDAYGGTRILSAGSETSGSSEHTCRGASLGFSAEPLKALHPVAAHSEGEAFSLATQRQSKVHFPNQMPSAPAACRSQQQTKPTKMFCGWCGAVRSRLGGAQTYCSSCGKMLDRSHRAEEALTNQMDVAGMRTATSLDAPRGYQGPWSSTCQDEEGCGFTATVGCAFPLAEQQTRALHQGICRPSGEGLFHPDLQCRDDLVQGFSI